MQTFFSLVCAAGLVCAIVFGVKAFKKKQRNMLLPFAIAVVACLGAAALASPGDDAELSQPSPTPTETVTAAASPTPTPTPESTPTPEPEPTPEPTPESTPEPTPAPTPELTPEPTPAPTTIHGRPSTTTVYVSRSHKIHSVPDCSGMSRYTEMTLAEADARGYDYCDNCW